MSWTETFGGKTQRPSQLSFRSIVLDDNLTLVWPLNAPPSSEVVADIMDVTPDAAGHSITMPPANEAGVGNNIIFRNLGGDSFDILNAAGGVIATVLPGVADFIYLRDNSTVAGTWGLVFYGVGSTTVDAAGLAGNGLEAIGSTLNVDLPVATKNATYGVGVNDRASMLTNTGGTISFNLPSAAAVGTGWFVGAINQGSGSLTLDPAGAETIDGQSTKVLAIGESCFVVSDGTNYRTIGYGRSISSTVSALSKDASGSGTSTMSSVEVAAQVINFTGTLTGARVLEFGTSPGYWFVYNGTTGAFTLTLRVNGADPGTVITQGNYSIVRSDGTNMDTAFTATSGTVTQVNTGVGLTGGPITSTGTIDLANTAVAAGAYGATGFTSFTVDAQGRLTAASQSNAVTFDIGIAKAGPQFILNSTSGDGILHYLLNSLSRVALGYTPASDYMYVNTYNNAGAYLATPMTIQRLSPHTVALPNFQTQSGVSTSRFFQNLQVDGITNLFGAYVAISGNLSVAGNAGAFVPGNSLHVRSAGQTTARFDSTVANQVRIEVGNPNRTWLAPYLEAGGSFIGFYDLSGGVIKGQFNLGSPQFQVFGDSHVSGIFTAGSEIRAYNDPSFRMFRSGSISYFQATADDWSQFNDAASNWDLVLAGASRLNINTTSMAWTPAGHTFLIDGIFHFRTFPTAGLPSAAAYGPTIVARTSAPGDWAFTNDGATWQLPHFT